MENISKSTHSKIIGALNISSGILFLCCAWGCAMFFMLGEIAGGGDRPDTTMNILGWGMILSIVIGIFIICAGVLALNQRGRLFVIVGSCFAILTIIGIPALILTLKAKSEFTPLFKRTIAEKSIKYCPICGQPNSQEADICETCGSKLSPRNSNS